MISYKHALTKFHGKLFDVNEYFDNDYAYVGWDHRPELAEFVHHYDPFDDQYFGIELELDERLDIFKLAEAVFPFGKAYEDGTPASEVITSPATFNASKMIVKRFFRRFTDIKKISDTVWWRGNHIHFSIDNLAKPVLDNIFTFFSSPKSAELTELVAERVANYSCERTDSRQKAHGTKGTALNTATGYKTWELRIFQAPNTAQGVLKNLEFTRAGIEFCKEESDFRNFIPWLKHNRRGHEHLVEFLKKEGAY